MKFFFTYVLVSSKDNMYYIGWTDDLERRIKRHNQGGVKSTKDRKPLELVYYEACTSKENAIKREKQLKSGFGRTYLKRRIGSGPVAQLVRASAS